MDDEEEESEEDSSEDDVDASQTVFRPCVPGGVQQDIPATPIAELPAPIPTPQTTHQVQSTPSSGSGRCMKCSQYGHLARDCMNPSRQSQSSQVGEDTPYKRLGFKKCYKCGGAHDPRECHAFSNPDTERQQNTFQMGARLPQQVAAPTPFAPQSVPFASCSTSLPPYQQSMHSNAPHTELYSNPMHSNHSGQTVHGLQGDHQHQHQHQHQQPQPQPQQTNYPQNGYANGAYAGGQSLPQPYLQGGYGQGGGGGYAQQQLQQQPPAGYAPQQPMQTMLPALPVATYQGQVPHMAGTGQQLPLAHPQPSYPPALQVQAQVQQPPPQPRLHRIPPPPVRRKPTLFVNPPR